MSIGPTSPSATRLRYALAVFGAVLVIGTLGYEVIEGWGIIESLYMTVITLTTVGFGEVHPLSLSGKVFTMFLVLGGVGTATYTVFAAAELLVEKQMRRLLGRDRMDQKLRRLRDHVIVCGYGRVGRQICAEFSRRRVPYVVIEREREQPALDADAFVVVGDATEDATLLEAGIERAKSLVCALASESDNVFITLTARQLNPQIQITARADSEGMERKLLRAGATRVVSPYQAGAMRMAVTTLQPNVVDFMNIVAGDRSGGYRLEEVEVTSASPFAGRSLREVEFRQRFGLMVVGIKRVNAEPIFGPSSDEVIRPGDILLLVGSAEKLESFAETAAGVAAG